MTSKYIDISYDSDFSINNLPYGIFSTNENVTHRIGVAVGDMIIDLNEISDELVHLSKKTHNIDEKTLLKSLKQATLNELMSLGQTSWSAVRQALKLILESDDSLLSDKFNFDRCIVPQKSAIMHLPAKIGDYTDFYSSIDHARNVGTMFRGADNALMPNWRHLPVGYHGRASSVVVSGSDVQRPWGQLAGANEATDPPSFAPCRLLDFELELAYFVGPGNQLGCPINVDVAQEHIFGFVLMNDWSARDIQKWEYVPLGPFTAKNFATTISPWVVTVEALLPYLTANPVQQPEVCQYLRHQDPFTFDIQLEVSLRPQADSQIDVLPTGQGEDRCQVVCRSNARHLYWTMKQQLAHHTVTGCNMRPGDLLASGTISGGTPDSYGSLLELSWRGSKPLTLAGDQQRCFLQDWDEVVIRGWAQAEDGSRVGFGECAGRVTPARPALHT